MFPSLRAQGNVNTVTATMFPRLPPPKLLLIHRLRDCGPVTLLPRPVNSKPTGPVKYQS